MNKEKLKRYKKNRAEFELIESTITKLQERLYDVPIVSGKVTKSGDDFPYIEEHMTVQMTEPKAAEKIKKRIREKEIRRDLLLSEIREVEEFITGMPEGIDKQIFEMVYLDGCTQKETAEAVGYSKGRISQIISQHLKD